MDELDRRVLAELQNGFPVDAHPYEVLAKKLNLTELEVFDSAKKLLEANAIRRISALGSSRKIGMTTTLAAASVNEESLEKTAEHLHNFTEITHNYLREGNPNLWFAIVAPTKERVLDILKAVENLEGVDWVEQYPATKLFKLNVNVGGR